MTLQLFCSGGETVIIDEVDIEFASSIWHVHQQKGYVKGWHNGRVWDLHKLIGNKMGIVGQVDHKDRNKLNCCRFNLRPATQSQNNANIAKTPANKSGYKGVSWHTKESKWRAQLSINNISKHIGYFDNVIEAARAYDRVAKETFGDFAYLNFPGEL